MEVLEFTAMRILVTGGTGFVGAWTSRAVQDAGHQVRFLVRDPAKLAVSAGALGVTTSDHVVGDMTDAEAVRRALDGCDAVVHCAAVVALDPAAAGRMARANLAGAGNVLGLAVERGLDPVVHVSSIAAVFRPDLDLLTGDLPLAEGLDAYGRSKAEVEAYARGLQDAGAPVQITYPGMVVGPPAGQMLGEATDGVRAAVRMRVIPGRGAAWTVCDVRDLGRVHAALLRPGRAPGTLGGRWGPPRRTADRGGAAGRERAAHRHAARPGPRSARSRARPGPARDPHQDQRSGDGVLHPDAGVGQRSGRAGAGGDASATRCGPSPTRWPGCVSSAGSSGLGG